MWRLLVCVAATLAAPGAAQAAPGALPTAAIAAVEWKCAAGAFHDGRYAAGGVELAYSEGPRTGRTILFLPGMGVPRRSYQAVAARLCERFHVVVLDQRGQGQSSWAPDGHYRVVDYGRDAASFIEHRLGGGPVIVSGHSLGGLVALWLAAERPDLVSGLNAEDNPFLMSERGRWEHHWVKPMFEATERRLRAYQASGRDPAVLARAFEAEQMVLPPQQGSYAHRVRALGKLLSNMEARGAVAADAAEQARLDATYSRWLAGQPVTNAEFLPRAILAGAPMMSAQMDPAVVHAAVTAELNDGFDHRVAMAKVRAPTLYWNSDQDLVGVLDQAEHDENVRVIGGQARVRHVVARNVGHLIHAEAPDLYAHEIRLFFGAD